MPFDRSRGFWVEKLSSQNQDRAEHRGNSHSMSASFEFVAAYDMNPRANEAYTHIHGHPSPLNTNLETIAPETLASHNCSVWLMSPPCQPYTSLSGQADNRDPRSKALRHLFTNVLPSLAEPPLYLAIENVPAFLWSEGRRMVVASLQHLNYRIEEFELCPTLFGVPNKRRRYFLIARRCGEGLPAAVANHTFERVQPAERPDCDRAIVTQKCSDPAKSTIDRHFDHGLSDSSAGSFSVVPSSYGVKYFLPSLSARSELQVNAVDGIRRNGTNNSGDNYFVGDEDLEGDQKELQCLVISREGSVVPMHLPPSSSDQIWGRWQPIYASPTHHAGGALPVCRFLDDDEQLQAWASAGETSVITEADLDCINRGTLKIDLARRCSVTTSCFTKGYARILRRAGPLFLQRHATSATNPVAQASQRPSLVLSIRRFTPSEQARLMCLPVGTVAPNAVVSPQNWHKLLGNSVNVHVCACVLLYMLCGPDS
jgi:site-specific DNA-cytosine methylase